MRWSDVMADASLRDLPYKIELNKWGQVVMSPANNIHAALQGKIAAFLERVLPHGMVLTECVVDTPEGAKVPDVAWCSPEFFARHRKETPFPVAPEICVEIRSPSNSRAAMAEKVGLYLDAGAQEVWIVRENGEIAYFTRSGEQPHSIFTRERPDFSGIVS